MITTGVTPPGKFVTILLSAMSEPIKLNAGQGPVVVLMKQVLVVPPVLLVTMKPAAP